MTLAASQKGSGRKQEETLRHQPFSNIFPQHPKDGIGPSVEC